MASESATQTVTYMAAPSAWKFSLQQGRQPPDEVPVLVEQADRRRGVAELHEPRHAAGEPFDEGVAAQQRPRRLGREVDEAMGAQRGPHAAGAQQEAGFIDGSHASRGWSKNSVDGKMCNAFRISSSSFSAL